MEQTNEAIIKKERKQMTRRALWIYREDGTYNNNPISETYYKDYYREKIALKYNVRFVVIQL